MQPIEAVEEDTKPITLSKLGQRLVELTHNLLECQRMGIASFGAESGLLHPIAVFGLSAQHQQQWWLEVQRSTISNYSRRKYLSTLDALHTILLCPPYTR